MVTYATERGWKVTRSTCEKCGAAVASQTGQSGVSITKEANPAWMALATFFWLAWAAMLFVVGSEIVFAYAIIAFGVVYLAVRLGLGPLLRTK